MVCLISPKLGYLYKQNNEVALTVSTTYTLHHASTIFMVFSIFNHFTPTYNQLIITCISIYNNYSFMSTILSLLFFIEK